MPKRHRNPLPAPVQLPLFADAASLTPHMVTATVTMPPGLKARLDAEAARQDRSRSWITAAAIAEYLAPRETVATSPTK